MRIYRRISKKKYLHGKRVYEYESFYVSIPKRYHNIVKAYLEKDLKVKVETCENGFTIRATEPPARNHPNPR